jgi:hypothetical protein
MINNNRVEVPNPTLNNYVIEAEHDKAISAQRKTLSERDVAVLERDQSKILHCQSLIKHILNMIRLLVSKNWLQLNGMRQYVNVIWL